MLEKPGIFCLSREESLDISTLRAALARSRKVVARTLGLPRRQNSERKPQVSSD